MWKLKKVFRFDAAHFLPNYVGPCARLHGHTWTLEITVASKELISDGSESGMVMDFRKLKEGVNRLLVGYLDHQCLNDTLSFRPTSENICKWLFHKLVETLPGLQTVGLWETPSSYCEYSSDV